MYSAWIKGRTDSGALVPEITSHSLDDIERQFPRYSVTDKQVLLMRLIERRSEYPGDKVELIPGYEYPMIWASGDREFLYLLGSLAERNLVRSVAGQVPLDVGSWSRELEITPAGWSFLDQHAQVSVISNQVFVAMSFQKDLTSAWTDGIHNGVKAAGFDPYRIDADPHLERIDAKIIAEIKNSRFLVADVTGQRPGVYFEAGYAQGLGLPVIWSVRKDDLDKVHFDTRQFNHIVWETPADLAEQLHYFILANIGKGRGG